MSKKRKNKKQHEEEGGEAWLLPYSDLMTLLLAVFIVLFAVGKMDQEKAKELADAFKSEVMSNGAGIFSSDGDSIIQYYQDPLKENSNGDGNSISDNSTTEGITEEELEAYFGKEEFTDLQKLQERLDTMVESGQLSADITTTIDQRGLEISLNNTILFDLGSAEIKSENKDVLIRIAEILNSLGKYIRIEGHTDNAAISTSIYPSNWELSTARATSVVRLFIDEANVDPKKLSAIGYGEYKPIADNSTAEGRAQNRRIDIIVLSEKYDVLEN